MCPDSEGLHAIANTTKQDREADVVFVHGLGGKSHSTWRHGCEGNEEHFFWPEELGKDLPNCGIWTVGYPAGVTTLGKPGMIIDKRAGNLSQKLANAGLGERPLLFITHSMGGLIVKSLIVGSQTLSDKDRKLIVSAVRGVVFCATPHRGTNFVDAAGKLGRYSGLADASLGGFICWAAADFFGRILRIQSHVEEMRANAEPLDILHDQFIEWQRNHQIPVDSYAENIGLFRTRWFLRLLPLSLVVPRVSANPGIAGHVPRDVDDDHLTLVKPPNRNHDVYAGVFRFITSALKPTIPPPPIIELSKILPKIELIDKNLYPQEYFTGRDWILEPIKEWLAGGTGSGVFRIEGHPGMGKTAIFFNLANKKKYRVVAVHACRHNQGDSTKAISMVKNLAIQMAESEHLREYGAILQQIAEPTIKKLDDPELGYDAGSLWRDLIAGPLKSLGPREQRVLIAIDALDEANDKNHKTPNEIAKLLTEVLDSLPDWLGVVITSRPEGLDALKRFKTLNLCGSENQLDIDQYIDKWLSSEVEKKLITCEQSKAARQVLKECSAGSFLYLIMVREAIEDNICSLKEPASLPTNLSKCYIQYFRRQFGYNLDSPEGLWRARVQPLISMVLASPEPLPLDVAREVLAWNETQERQVLRAVGSLFPIQVLVGNKCITPFHKTVADWLLDENQPGDFFTGTKQGHKSLAEYCWIKYPQKRPLRDYPFRNGAHHLLADGRVADATKLLTCLLETDHNLVGNDRDRVFYYAKLLTAAAGDPDLSEEEAKKIEPLVLQKILRGQYMTAQLKGCMLMLLRHHWLKFSEIIEELLKTDDYVIRHAIAEALADDYLESEKKSHVEEILKKEINHSDLNHRELGGYALKHICSKNREHVNPEILNPYANGEIYPYRSIIDDLMLDMVLQEFHTNHDPGWAMNLLDRDSIFWNPIWDFNQMAIDWIHAADHFVRGKEPSLGDKVAEAYSSLKQTEELRQELLRDKIGKRLSELGQNPLDGYYSLGKHPDWISNTKSVLKNLGTEDIQKVFEVFLAHPIWRVTEEAADVLAAIVDEEPKCGVIIENLFSHNLWRVQYGAAEAAFLVRTSNHNVLFKEAINKFHQHSAPLLRGNCAENLTAWLLSCNQPERDVLLREFKEVLRFWIREDYDCWVLDHIFRLLKGLTDTAPEAVLPLIETGESNLLTDVAGNKPWYQLDRQDFLKHIEMKRRQEISSKGQTGRESD